jgi:hypothetical protein
VVTEIRIYYEGHRLLKPGFSKFFEELRHRAGERRCKFELIPGGSGSTACRDFGIAIETHPHAWNILLIDSEGPLTRGLSASLCVERAWPKSSRDSIFWMVQMMESWFHADKEALERFYGPKFKKNALKPNLNVEEKGDYFSNKTSHGPKLLAEISPMKVQKAAPNCGSLFAAVLAKLDEPGSRKNRIR